MSKTIWIINHYARCEGHRHSEIAEGLSKRGIHVVVFASSFLHNKLEYITEEKIKVQEINPYYTFVWIRTTPAYRANSGGRILNMFSFALEAKAKSFQIAKLYGEPDVVVGSSVHPFAWEAAYSIAHKFKANFVAEVRDLWPLSLIEIAHISPNSPAVKLFTALEKRAYNRSDKILVTLPNGSEYICKTYPNIPKNKITWVPNALNTDKADLSVNSSLPDALNQFLELRWCCIYTGSIVESECVLFMLDSMKILRDKGLSDIYFAIIGDGDQLENVKIKIESEKLENVKVFPRIDKGQVMAALKKSKVCLAALHNLPLYKYGLSMNKLNDYLYSGTPTIFACDAPNPVSRISGSITMPYGDAIAYARAIEKIYRSTKDEVRAAGNAGKELIRSEYSYESIVDSYEKLLGAY